MDISTEPNIAVTTGNQAGIVIFSLIDTGAVKLDRLISVAHNTKVSTPTECFYVSLTPNTM